MLLKQWNGRRGLDNGHFRVVNSDFSDTSAIKLVCMLLDICKTEKK